MTGLADEARGVLGGTSWTCRKGRCRTGLKCACVVASACVSGSDRAALGLPLTLVRDATALNAGPQWSAESSGGWKEVHAQMGSGRPGEETRLPVELGSLSKGRAEERQKLRNPALACHAIFGKS